MAFNSIFMGPVVANLNGWHLAALLAVVLILFGGRRLPELAKGMARGMRIFRDELHGIQRDMEEPPTPSDKPSQDDKPADKSPR